MRPVAYLTDVEGRWDKVEDFCRDNPLVSLGLDGSLHVHSGAVFVFGGDAIDRGPYGRRLVSRLLEAKLRQPESVVLLAGNRDINKMRLVRELRGMPPSRAPEDLIKAGAGALLSFIFEHTMGARHAFSHRRAELEREGRPTGDDDVAQSYLEDLEPEGDLSRYLAASQLAFREGRSLFVHGGVTEENLYRVPTEPSPASSVDEWIARLNEFYARSVEAFRRRAHGADGTPGWASLVAYQAPVRGTYLNQGSVVYARPTNERGDPALPREAVIRELARSGVDRVVVGHTPSGDCPAVLRDDTGFELILADNSYGRLESGPRVVFDERMLRIEGTTVLDSNEQARVAFDLEHGAQGPLGRRDARSGRLVKARLARGDYLLFRALEGYGVEQIAATEKDLSGLSLESPTPPSLGPG